jgi:tetratricopeptide (TPR) repeat protein
MNHLVKLEQEALKLQNKGDLSQAVKLFKEIVKENPNWEFGICFYNIACCLEDLGKLEEAKENYIKAIEYDDEDDIRLGGFASFLYLHGSTNEAFQAHIKLLKLEKQRNLDMTSTLDVIKILGKRMGLTEDEIVARINQQL